MLRSAALQGPEAKCTIGQGSRKLGSISYSPEGPAESRGLGLWEGESGFSEAIGNCLNFPRAHREPLGGFNHHPPAVGAGWATLLPSHRGFQRRQILPHAGPRAAQRGAPCSLNPRSLQLFSQTGQLQPASALSKSLFSHAYTCSFIRVFTHFFIYSFISSSMHVSSYFLHKFIPHLCTYS